MTPKEFINKDIQCGDKVRLTLASGKVVVCFFGGYHSYEGVQPSLGYIDPVFYAVGKKGHMVKRSPFGPDTWTHISFRSLKDIEKYSDAKMPAKEADPSKRKYEVTLYFHTNVTVEVEADDETKAVDAARNESCRDEYAEAILSGLQEDDSPDVNEITE